MKIESTPHVTLVLSLSLSEEEARALEALGGYGADAFIKRFYEFLGESYMKPHEAGLRSFLEGTKSIAGFLTRTDDARLVFTGARVASDPRFNKPTEEKS